MKCLLSPILLLALCANAGPTWEALSMSQKQVRLDRIASACHLPRGVFKVRTGDDFRFQPSPKTRYRNVKCALTKLEQIHGLPRMGYINREAYEPEPNQKAPK